MKFELKKNSQGPVLAKWESSTCSATVSTNGGSASCTDGSNTASATVGNNNASVTVQGPCSC